MKTPVFRTMIATAVLTASTWSTSCLAERESGPDDGVRRGAKLDISGTWLVEVTARDCTSGAALSVFPVMNAFVASGTLLEFGSTPMVTPSHRTPGFGNWRRIGNQRFRAVFSLFHLPDAVNIGSLHRIERVITMSGPGRFVAEAKVRIFDPTGNVELAAACATETARRIS